ncbi:DHHC zinc finger domain containing protein [Trichomonas vaginalis G3]|uniref:Palmitoyltransferase n=2 Tax=Trichomonas vaginalis (strain ATCC PRA-98 / G3) TaxID=412133 RepID=A2FBD0_TRIV3|nr:DHHC zinc finger domain containing protein [Trichomonas vaginalis G3]|eukprot:XP_001310740.1 DHHC zinc finger domain containing protein [Trichomonas vaginalis G3]
MNGVAMFQEQVTFAKSNPLPPRSSFSVTARRFVIRADHICAYMQSWVGFKNHKYFIQTTLWSAIYSLLYMVGQIPIIYEGIKLIIQKKKVTVQIIMSLVIFLTVLFAAYIALISLRHFTVAMINLSHNETITERYNKKPQIYDRGSACKNCEEICGSRWLFITWIFPCFCCYYPKMPKWDDEHDTGVIDNNPREDIV